jgi:hypothetical protein
VEALDYATVVGLPLCVVVDHVQNLCFNCKKYSDSSVSCNGCRVAKFCSGECQVC